MLTTEHFFQRQFCPGDASFVEITLEALPVFAELKAHFISWSTIMVLRIGGVHITSRSDRGRATS